LAIRKEISKLGVRAKSLQKKAETFREVILGRYLLAKCLQQLERYQETMEHDHKVEEHHMYLPVELNQVVVMLFWNMSQCLMQDEDPSKVTHYLQIS
jgi:hypothetical protein